MKYEIWLEKDSTHFGRGLAHLEDGSIEQLAGYCNVSIRQDSFIIGTMNEYGEIDDRLRWFPKPGVIEFYSWENDLESIVFHNETGYDIYIFRFAYLKPGESVEIRKTDRKHAEYLRHWNAEGLGRLIETSYEDPEYKALEGKYGIILSRISAHNWGKTVLKFILADCLLGKEPDTEGFETSAGELSYEENNRIVLQTEKTKYVFAYDGGDGTVMNDGN